MKLSCHLFAGFPLRFRICDYFTHIAAESTANDELASGVPGREGSQ